jgi:hypothetical protein
LVAAVFIGGACGTLLQLLLQHLLLLHQHITNVRPPSSSFFSIAVPMLGVHDVKSVGGLRGRKMDFFSKLEGEDEIPNMFP